MTSDSRLEEIRQVRSDCPCPACVDSRYLLALIDTLQRERDEARAAYERFDLTLRAADRHVSRLTEALRKAHDYLTAGPECVMGVEVESFTREAASLLQEQK